MHNSCNLNSSLNCLWLNCLFITEKFGSGDGGLWEVLLEFACSMFLLANTSKTYVSVLSIQHVFVCVCSHRIGSKCQWTPSFTGSRPRRGHREAAHPAERPLLTVKNFHHRQVPELMKMRNSSQLCVIFFEWWCTLFGRVPVVCYFL